MPRMHSSSSQCCLCSIGVFMFLGGIMMISTGASLILNYGIVDEELLIEELRNDEGKRIVGIILICVGLVFTIVSFSVSLYYLCIKPNKKPSEVKPDDLKKIPNGSAQSSAREPGSSLQRPGSKDSVRSNVSAGQGARRKISPIDAPVRPKEKSAGSQFSQSVPTIPHRSKHKHKSKKKRLVNKTQLEGIKEIDTISRKTIDVDYNYKEYVGDTPRSQSELDNNSLTNTSDNSVSKVPVFYVSDHTDSESNFIPGTVNITEMTERSVFVKSENSISERTISPENSNQDDSDDQILSFHKDKQTRRHSLSSHDNLAFDGEHEVMSTGSESTITRNILNDEQSQTSSL